MVLSALLDTMDSENGLAFVLAHELAHYRNRDHLRGMGRSAVLLAGSVLLTGANSGLSSLLTPAYSLQWATYSQERESAADALALDALDCLYGHTGGATELFERLRDLELETDWSVLHYFASHPEVGDRIEELQDLAAQQGYASADALLIECRQCRRDEGTAPRED